MSTETQKYSAVFEQSAANACIEIFGSYGVPLEKQPKNVPIAQTEFLICAVIGFSGRNLRGALVLAADQDLLQRSNSSPVQTWARDWMGELANQVLGRMKNDLLTHAIEIYMNLPAVLIGQHLAPLPRKELNPIRFSSGNSMVGLWVECEFAEGFKMSETSDSDAAGPASGETLIF